MLVFTRATISVATGLFAPDELIDGIGDELNTLDALQPSYEPDFTDRV